MSSSKTTEVKVDVSHCGDKKKAANFFQEATNNIFNGSKRIQYDPNGTITGILDHKKRRS